MIDYCEKCGKIWSHNTGPIWHEDCGGLVIWGYYNDAKKAKGFCADVCHIEDTPWSAICELKAGHEGYHQDGNYSWDQRRTQ